MRSLAFAATSILAVGLVPAVARAEDPAPADPAERVAALESSVREHRTAKDADAMTADLGEISKVHAEIADPKLKSRLAALAGNLLAAANDDVVERAAIRTLGKLADPDTWRFLAPYVRQPDPDVVPPLLLDALDAAGKLKSPAAVEPMLGIVAKSKAFAASVAAMKALSQYGDRKGVRAKILTELVATVRKDQPGWGTRHLKDHEEHVRTGDETKARWDALNPVLVEACNKLTGQNYGTAKDWFDIVDKYKARLERELFPQG